MICVSSNGINTKGNQIITLAQLVDVNPWVLFNKMKYGFILKSDSMQTSAIFIASMNTPEKILLYQELICLQCTKQQ